jgi:prolyl-tRNA synthetase
MKNDKGITAEKDDFSEWFTQLMIKADLADYSKVSGCIVFKPASYAIWEKLVREIDGKFKKIGIKNAYFPLFIPESLLTKEADHVEGFTPEVAWVTHAGDKKLDERLAVRPTSEAIMYDSYAKWIRSWKDLPLKINIWNSVVRWEFKHPVPFLRTREFLWQEGHNVYATHDELLKDRDAILDIYLHFLKEYMALPGLVGKKTDKEKFAGAVDTYSIEFLMPNGKAIQGPDYHDDGQNFAKAYGIEFLDTQGKKQRAYQSTYAITTRMLGVMFAIHSDQKGLIIPPRLAEHRVVIVPIFSKDAKEHVLKESKKILKTLEAFNPLFDDREEYSPGWKFSEWELKGIPVRVEIGPKDIAKKQAVIVKRTDGTKKAVKLSGLKKEIASAIEEIQETLYAKAEAHLKKGMTKADSMEALQKAVSEKKIALVPLCASISCEDGIKEKTTGIKTLNMPLKQPSLDGKKCIFCRKKADYHVYMGKSY